MLRRRSGWLGLCGVLVACAQLGGFEDFKSGSSNGGSSATEASGGDGTSPGPGPGSSAENGGESGRSGTDGGGSPSHAAGSNATGAVAGIEMQGDGGATANGVAGAPAAGNGGGEPGLLDQCVLLMHFEEASWSMKRDEVRDSSGFGNHGTPATASLTTSALTQGKFGRAAKLDGSGGVIVPDSASLHVDSALTVSAWIYPTALDSGGPGIVNKRRGYNSDTAFSLFLWDTEPTHLYADIQGEESRFHSLAEFVVSEWYHVALVFDGSAPSNVRSTLYVNGVADVTSSETSGHIEPYTSDLVIGDLVGGGARFSGFIDEVAVWRRALSAAEVHDVFAASAPL